MTKFVMSTTCNDSSSLFFCLCALDSSADDEPGLERVQRVPPACSTVQSQILTILTEFLDPGMTHVNGLKI